MTLRPLPGLRVFAATMSGLVTVTLLALAWLAALPWPARAHDPYGEWRQPGTGKSCCSGLDCRAVRSYLGDDGVHYVWLAGAWRPVPWERVLRIASPDGSSHVCASDETLEIHCFVAGAPRG